MPYPGLLDPELLPLQQSSVDMYLRGDTQNTVLLSLWGERGLASGAPSVCLGTLNIFGRYEV